MNEENNKEEVEEPIPEINEEEETVTAEPDAESNKGRQLCSEVLATKIHGVILQSIIHKLHQILVQRVCFFTFILIEVVSGKSFRYFV